MRAVRSGRHNTGFTLFLSFTHLAMRPWTSGHLGLRHFIDECVRNSATALHCMLVTNTIMRRMRVRSQSGGCVAKSLISCGVLAPVKCCQYSFKFENININQGKIITKLQIFIGSKQEKKENEEIVGERRGSPKAPGRNRRGIEAIGWTPRGQGT